MGLKERIHSLQPQMVEALKELVRIPSVQRSSEPGAPFGKEAALCLDKALEISKNLGFRTYNMDHYVGWAEYGEGEDMVAVLCHLDVVPEGDGWTVCRPYEPVVADGKIFGRGTIDDKGPGMSALFGLKALAEEGFQPKRRIRVLFGCNEETGSEDMKYYREHGGEIPVSGFTPDACFPLIIGEKGCMNLMLEKKIQQGEGWKLVSIHGGTAPNIVPQYAKAEILLNDPQEADALSDRIMEKVRYYIEGNSLTVEADGVPAHGSTPQMGENAIGRLCLFLQKLPLCEEAAEVIGFLAEKLGMESTGETLGVDLQDELSGALTLNLGMIRSERAEDFLSVQVVLDSRCPVTYGYEDLVPKVKNEFAKGGWTVGKEGWANPLYQSEDSEHVKKLLKVYRTITGDYSPALCIGGGTYAKSIPNIMAFGPGTGEDDNHAHGADEYIELDKMEENAWIYAEAIRALAE